VLRHIHSNKYLLNCLLIIAFNNKIMLSRLAHPARRCVGHQPRGQKTDIGCRRQRREHNPPFRRSSEHSAARLAASSVRLYSPHSRPPVSRCRGCCVGPGTHTSATRLCGKNVAIGGTVLDDSRPFELKIKRVRGRPLRFLLRARLLPKRVCNLHGEQNIYMWALLIIHQRAD